MSKLPFIPTSEINGQASSKAVDYEMPLDLNQALITRPASTFLLVSDIHNDQVGKGDILVVDRSLEPKPDQMVIAVSDGDLKLVKYPVKEIWGVVTYIIHKAC